MKKISLLLLLTVVLMSANYVAARDRIPIEDDKPIQIYALGALSKVGVFQLNLADLSNPTRLNTGSIQYTGSGFGGGGTFLGAEEVVGIKYNYVTMAFEATAAGNDDGAWGPSFYKSLNTLPEVYDMTWDEKANVVYCWYKFSDYVRTLGIYDPRAHTVTRVGNAANTPIYGLAIDKEGQLWGVGSMGRIYQINKETAVATDITGGSGVSTQFQSDVPMSAAIDPESGLMYVVAKNSYYDTFSTLTKIDLETVKAEVVGQLNGYYNCLSIVGSSIPAGAPAPAENLLVTFDGESTVLTFTAPTKTAGDKTLSGMLTYTVSVDGEEATTGTVEAGAVVDVRINPTGGFHEISVTLSNSEGTSRNVKITSFCGYDTPGNISGLMATADGTKVTLSWDAPEGQHGSVIDLSKLRYRIERNGEVLVGDEAETRFSDTVDGLYRQFDYKVTVVYDGTEGEGRSVLLMAGNPYEAPYEINLNDAETLGEVGITVIDPNTDNVRESGKWELVKKDGEGIIQSYSTYAFFRDDYAWLPLSDLKANANYTLRFKGAASADRKYGTFNDANLRVLIADKPTGVVEDYKELESFKLPLRLVDEDWEEGDEIIFDWTEYSIDFTVEADGDYTLGLLDYAPQAYNYYYMVAKDLVLDVTYSVPMPVTGLEATPQAENNRNIDLTFTLPTKDTEGRDLATITKVEIIRGNDVIATLDENLKPGETVSYTDEDAPRGIKSYRVIAYVGSEASAASIVSVCVGYLNDLQVELVSSPDGEKIAPDGEGVIKVKVTNNGFEQVLFGAYDVALICDGKEVGAVTGEPLATDASIEYEFELLWHGEMPVTVEYIVKVFFSGDEKQSDNEIAPITVTFVDDSGVHESGEEVPFVITGDRITARGETVAVYTVDGKHVVSGNGEIVTLPLAKGMYVVGVDNKSYKITL